MKVGIMSMQRIINYGSFLQAYGLKKTVESLGHTVEFVDYKIEPPIVVRNVVKSNKYFRKILNGTKVLFSSKYRKKRELEIKQNKSFSEYYNKFYNDWLPILGVKETKNYTPELDTLIIGSDEVFNCTQTGLDVGYSLQLFGKDHNAKRLISYAASFGNTTIEKLKNYDKDKEIGELLNRFDVVSTRDYNSHSIVKELSTVNIVDNVDPVIISDYEDEVLCNVDLKDYVVVYAYSGRITDEEAEKIQDFAHRNGKKTLSIGVMQSFTDEYVCVNPFKMLAYIKNADYVITDTFHGTVFSIKYQIPFATIIRDSNRQKLTDLLQKFDLENRTVVDINELEKIVTTPMDKEKVIEHIESYKGEALEYLTRNI